ncbi:YgfZ/GcvT domain-containing protein [Coxiella burnetii]|uniref:Aminomethyltransferase family protein n=2 Tax=Coxiella burnetii TaxID=777 RepID=Q83E96_COXBU|nr:folate-binding protein YgfZ [Coxiella burnetii]NP_819468.1 aminomethyltransferase family protein [Coxiella burnetii RSA 493]AAO89982.1 aminomethyltransferase family protein [Coxiella burnetii RSA 493]ABS78373.1 aminomethyltransferase family protein [Coxiella burnetii Dugway 5J108-111]ABX77738.1 glycine cleavage T-protein (aminomethyl transferase) domain protein [Coxiella burnetii RSA 331]ACJ20600.1 aminomethyltransferase family protein [Coxiella burnetii CbuK_Q154]AML48748.1 glycine cleava
MQPITIAIDPFGFILVKGENAATFLQGQLTCDVREINEIRGALGACCDPKGRMVANFFVFQKNKDYYFLLPKSMISITIAHLKKYAVFSKVELLAVNEAETYSLPEITLKELDENDWRSLNVRAGLVWVYPQTSGKLIPQMINLQKWGGISFTKGCYIGQEIIARTEHLGKLKRHLYRAFVDSETPPTPGDELKNQNDQTMGIVVEAARKNTEYELLVVIQDVALENGDIAFNQFPLKNVQPVAGNSSFISSAIRGTK